MIRVFRRVKQQCADMLKPELSPKAWRLIIEATSISGGGLMMADKPCAPISPAQDRHIYAMSGVCADDRI